MEACELLSYSESDGSFLIMFHDEDNEQRVISFPLHEDFLDAFGYYVKCYRAHIEDKLNDI